MTLYKSLHGKSTSLVKKRTPLIQQKKLSDLNAANSIPLLKTTGNVIGKMKAVSKLQEMPVGILSTGSTHANLQALDLTRSASRATSPVLTQIVNRQQQSSTLVISTPLSLKIVLMSTCSS